MTPLDVPAVSAQLDTEARARAARRRSPAAARGHAGWLLLGLALVGGQAVACVPAGQWATPDKPAVALPAADLWAGLERRPVVLLGELHDRAEHHRWQLHVIAGLHARRSSIVLGFEMFPRRVQPVLDRWVAGELGEAEFLTAAEWTTVWNIDAALYLPLFHYARMHRIPMVALNVERSLIRAVAEKGYDAVPAAQREGVGRPAAAPPAYRRMLEEIFRDHPPGEGASAGDDARLLGFVEGQTTWDRAMAEAIVAAAKRHPDRQVIGVMGNGHTRPGAVPHQLRDLGVTGTAVLLPSDPGADCARLAETGADAVFGLAAPKAEPVAGRPRLGIAITTVKEGVRVDSVEAGSIAATAGLRAGDVIVEMAGRPTKVPGEVRRAVERQAPGTWLPLRVRRESGETEIVARFPP